MDDIGFSWRMCSAQRGAATLTITVVLLLVATLSALMAAQVGLMEQRLSGTDIRRTEVYAAATGGLEYALNRLERLMRESRSQQTAEIFLDPTRWEAGYFGEGARLVISADSNSDWLPAGTVAVADEERSFYPLPMVADAYQYEVVYTALTPMDDPEGATPIVIDVVVTARASADSHVQKTVGVAVTLGFSPLFPWSDGNFYTPPVVLEGCITGLIQGQPGVFPGSGLAVATTQGLAAGVAINDCLTADQLKECSAGHAGSHHSCPSLSQTSLGVAQPQGSLWNTIFGPISRAELKDVAARYPNRLLWVDQSFTHPGWSGDQWHLDVGTSQQPVILFFADAVGCPALSGSVHIHGVIYFENAECGVHGWGDGIIHGTVAVAGDLDNLNGNSRVMATEMGFTADVDDRRFGWTYRFHYAEVPGSWRDFGF